MVMLKRLDGDRGKRKAPLIVLHSLSLLKFCSVDVSFRLGDWFSAFAVILFDD
jgi:hypothetical protein